MEQPQRHRGRSIRNHGYRNFHRESPKHGEERRNQDNGTTSTPRSGRGAPPGGETWKTAHAARRSAKQRSTPGRAPVRRQGCSSNPDAPGNVTSRGALGCPRKNHPKGRTINQGVTTSWTAPSHPGAGPARGNGDGAGRTPSFTRDGFRTPVARGSTGPNRRPGSTGDPTKQPRRGRRVGHRRSMTPDQEVSDDGAHAAPRQSTAVGNRNSTPGEHGTDGGRAPHGHQGARIRARTTRNQTGVGPGMHGKPRSRSEYGGPQGMNKIETPKIENG